MKGKSFLFGFIMALVLTMSVGVFAVSRVSKQISVQMGGTTIVIDGVKMAPKDVNNQSVEPILYNGTTYVPIRFISEVFNKSVKYVGETATIFIGEPQKQEAILLRDMTPYKKTAFTEPNYGAYGGWTSTPYAADRRFTVINWSKTGAMKIADRSYVSQSTMLSDGVKENSASYLLDSKYQRIEADFGIDDNSTSAPETYGRVEIYGDGKLLKRAMKSKGQAIEHLEVDLTGIRVMTINVKGNVTVNQINGDTLYTDQALCNLINITMYPVAP